MTSSHTLVLRTDKADASQGRQMLNDPGGGWCYKKQSCKKIAAKAFAGISVLTLKSLSQPL